MHAQYRVAGADDAWPQQRSRRRQERRVWRDEFVLPRKPDDFVNRRAVFAFPFDFLQQRVYPRLCPRARQLIVLERLCREGEKNRRQDRRRYLRRDGERCGAWLLVAAYPCGQRAREELIA